MGSVNGRPGDGLVRLRARQQRPDDTYRYMLADGSVKTVSRPTGGTWLFAPAQFTEDPNKQHMKLARDGTVVAVNGGDDRSATSF